MNPEADNLVTQAPKWMGLACFLGGLVLGVAVDRYVPVDRGEPSRIERAEVERIVSEKMDGYAKADETLRIIRAEVVTEKRARIEWETLLRNWCQENACRCRRPGAIGAPAGAVGSALETPPPPVEK